MPNRTQRYESGKKLRDRYPREAHGLTIGARTRNPMDILGATDKSRLSELLPERYKRMSQNAFSFYRGGAALMAFDLSKASIAGINVQACGDCHLMNFGVFSTPENNILFDIDDFDETLPNVDFTVDVKRLAASVAVAADAAGMSEDEARHLSLLTVQTYRHHMLKLSELSPLEIWHSQINLEKEIVAIDDHKLREDLKNIINKARGSGLSKDDNFPHLVLGDAPTIADRPPIIFHLQADADKQHRFDATKAFERYRSGLTPDRMGLFDCYTLKDLAFKAVGVGSVGTFCCVGLFMSDDGDPLFLQVKEAQQSVLEQFGVGQAYRDNAGRRVVEGQRMMQAASDIFLGWTQDANSGREFYIRRLKNRRLGSFSEIAEQKALRDYAALCGKTLARAHARSGDSTLISGYMGKSEVFDEALATFALSYAAQTKRDYDMLVRAMTIKTS